MMLYVVVWFIVGYAVELEENFWHFLTYWIEGVMVVYFTFAFGVVLHGISQKVKENSGDESKFYFNAVVIGLSMKKSNALKGHLNVNESLQSCFAQIDPLKRG